MQWTRITSSLFVVGISGIASIIACGSSGGGGASADAKLVKDAPTGSGSGSGSGSQTATDALGATCTAGSNAQGTCPTGYVCLNLQGATNAYCSKTCTAGSADSCNTGRTGPGYAACILTVTDPNNNNAQTTVCGVICGDVSGNVCPATATCNGTCTGTLKCDETLKNSNGSAVGSACN
ncbi:hypothetical protein BH11MYX1_BH11MYX1_42590 [soil metagenome]